MRRFVWAFAVAVCCAASGFGQSEPGTKTDFTPVDFTFRGGVAMPLDRDLFDSTPVTLTIGADYLLRFSLVRGSEMFISWDWVRSRRGINTIALNQRFFTGPSTLVRGEGYMFLGLGGAWYGSIDFDRAALAVRGGIGAFVGPNTLVELGGSAARDIDGFNPSFVSLTVGYRF